VRALYDSEILHVDGYLKELFARVPRADDALFVFSADHGEEFLEHGAVGHGHNLYGETTRVPLIVRFPDRALAGTVVSDPVSLVDVFPTVLAAVGGAGPARGAGRPLLRGDAAQARPIVAELLRNTNLQACVEGRWKFLSDSGDPTVQRLFDLQADPLEREDRSASEAARVERFQAFFAAYRRLHAGGPAGAGDSPITPEQAEALRAFGYGH
jgi:arylsulfatase A-like enzyme